MRRLLKEYVNLKQRVTLNQRIRRLLTSNSMVLEIGSGNNPQACSSILLDKYIATTTHHRSGSAEIKILNEKPFILGDGNKLPFKNKSIDVIICRHVIEHVDNPKAFLGELQRVGKRGYLEWPSIFSELISGGFGEQAKIQGLFPSEVRGILEELEHGSGSKGHKWYIVPIGETLYFVPKIKDIYPLYLIFGAYYKRQSKHRHYSKVYSVIWTEDNVLNVKVISDRTINHASETIKDEFDLQEQISILKEMQCKFTGSDLWEEIDRRNILCCPDCREGSLSTIDSETLSCPICNREYPKIGNVRVFLNGSHGQ